MNSKELMALPLGQRNELFESLAPSERAVLVAEDVLAQVAANVYHVRAGSYLSRMETPIVGNFQDQASNVVTCTVCAIGATFMSCARLGNQAENPNPHRDMGATMVNVTTRAFTPWEMRAMEFILETNDYSRWSMPTAGTVKNRQELSMFSKGEKMALNAYREALVPGYDREDTMQAQAIVMALMENVIENGGQLVVPGIEARKK